MHFTQVNITNIAQYPFPLFFWRFMSFCSPRPRWVVPVLPKGELEVLLEAAIDLSKKGGSAQNVLFHRGALWH